MQPGRWPAQRHDGADFAKEDMWRAKRQARPLPKWVYCCNAEVIGPFTNKCSISLDGVVLAYVGGASAALQKEITQKRPDGEHLVFLATTSWPSKGKLVWCPAPFGSVLALGQNTA
jgi:hypothetical protein